MEHNRVTFAERTSSHHRSHIIINRADANFYLAEFDNVEQFDFFLETLGVTYEPATWWESPTLGIVREYLLSHVLRDGGYFKGRDELPVGSKPIKALSNGYLVTCYFFNDGRNVTLFRPNPNARNVYHPMTLEQQINHRAVYGSY